jgi:hypothetical protein
VGEVCKGYEMLELDIPGGDTEMTLAEAIHGWILWEKCNIILKPIDQASRPASPQPPPRAPSMSLSSPPAAPQHCPSPSSPGQPTSPASSPPPLPAAKKQKLPSKTQLVSKEPPKKKEQPKKKQAKEAPKLPCDQTYEECYEQANKEVDEHFKRKELEKKQPIYPSKSAFIIGMAEVNRKKFILPSDYSRWITKSFEKEKSAGSSSDVPHLGAYKKQSIPPLVVLPADQQELIDFMKGSGLSAAKVAGRKNVAIHLGVARWKYEFGKSLVPIELVPSFQRKCSHMPVALSC